MNYCRFAFSLFFLASLHIFGQYSTISGITFAGLNYQKPLVADLDQDGFLDIIVPYQKNETSNIAIFKRIDSTKFKLADTVILNAKNLKLSLEDLNADNMLDLICVFELSKGLRTLKILNNLGAMKFGNFYQSSNLIGDGNVLAHDFNNDGYIDLFVNASYSDSTGALLFKSKAGVGFGIDTTKIPVSTESDLAVLDYDRNGWKDIILSGKIRNDTIVTRIYRNMKAKFSKVKDSTLTPLHYSKIALGDYNSDGFMDVVLSGISKSNDTVQSLFCQNKSRTYKKESLGRSTFLPLKLALQDINHDGKVDLIGADSTQIYISMQNQTTTSVVDTLTKSLKTILSAPGHQFCVGDLNNDGNAEIIFSKGTFLGIYFNKSVRNEKPTITLIAEGTNIQGYSFVKWRNGRDDKTNVKSISYELFLTNNDSTQLVRSPSTRFKSGFRQKVSLGSNFYSKAAVFRGVSSGALWGVFPVDNALIGGGSYYNSITASSGSSTILGTVTGGGGTCIPCPSIKTKDTLVCPNTVLDLPKKTESMIWYSVNSGIVEEDSDLSYEATEPDSLLYVDLTPKACEQSYILNVIIRPMTPTNLPVEQLVCPENNTIKLTANVSLKSINWFTNGVLQSDKTNELVLKNSVSNIKIKFSARDTLNCISESTTLIKIANKINLVSTSDTTLDYGSELVLIAKGASSYVWKSADYFFSDPNASSVGLTATTSTLIYITGQSGSCSYLDSVKVNVIPIDFNKLLFIPNTFSPNKDGSNETFKVFGKGFLTLKFVVKDRAGNVVFRADESNFLSDQWWDGGTSPQGVYFWNISGKYENGTDVRINRTNSGTIKLIR